jgi:hypothetical protein
MSSAFLGSVLGTRGVVSVDFKDKNGSGWVEVGSGRVEALPPIAATAMPT